MKRLFVVLACILAVGAAASGQSMMGASSTSDDASSMATPDTAPGEELTARQLRLAVGTGGKVIYTNLAAAQALARKGPVVLFFAADWCPTCIVAMKDINANGVQLKDVTIVMVDYDTEKELKKRFGVTVQHTFVQINATGTRLGIWNGGGVDVVLKRVKRA